MWPPQRIVCLSPDSAEICDRLGVWDQVVAVSAFVSQSERAPRPVVAGFSKVDAAKILAARPDLVIGFCDVQADIAALLIRRGLSVLVTNQRTLAEISEAIRLIGGAVGKRAQATRVVRHFEEELESLRRTGKQRPRVYFEEWHDPLIFGVGWVSELIELVGGRDIFRGREGAAASDRVVDEKEVLAANPDFIFVSWCGKTADLEAMKRREKWSEITAFQRGHVFEIPSTAILQPAPNLLLGARRLSELLWN